MAFDESYVERGAAEIQLRQLCQWLDSRDTGHPRDSPEMPPPPEVHRQFKQLARSLRQAATELVFRGWRGASGTVIMQAVFTMERFYNGCADFLYLFQHCACKIMNEAVVEGMGGKWDAASAPRRHLGFERSEQEAVLSWSAPWPYHPEAELFINHALTHHFGAGKQWHFSRDDERQRGHAWKGGSKVIDRHLSKDVLRLPSACYGAAPPS